MPNTKQKIERMRALWRHMRITGEAPTAEFFDTLLDTLEEINRRLDQGEGTDYANALSNSPNR